jgi:uncharacterized membrane protein
MALCPKCGSQVAEGLKFCGACGSSIGAEGSAPATPPSPPSSPGTAGSAGGIPANVAAMLTYLPLCLIGLVCAILFAFVLEPYKQDRLIRFHAWQSLALHVIFVAFWIGWTIISLVLTAILHFLAILTVPVSMLVGLGALVLMVILMVKAYSGEKYKVPFVGDWAEKQAGN